MNFKRLAVFIIAVLLVFSLNTIGKTKKITKVGVYPLIGKPGEITDASKLKELLEKHADRIKEAFEKADAGYLYDGFMAKVNSGAIEETQLPKGQEIPWMAFKVGKKIKAVKDLVWAANKPLDVFALTVEYECKDYVLIIPKGCGNLTVMDVKNTYANCDIKVSPEKVNIGGEITVDLSGSKCAVKYEVTVLHVLLHLPLAQLVPAARLSHERDVSEPGKRTAKRLEDEDLARGIRQVLLGPDDVGNAHRVIVDYARKVVEERAVRALDHVVLFALPLELDRAAHDVVDDERP